MRRLMVSLFLLLLSFGAAADLSPKSRTIELKEFTDLVVDVMPDLAVQLVFPFVLDSPKNNPPFKFELTNRNIFSVGDEDIQTIIKGQNTLAVTVNKPDTGGEVFKDNTYIGNLLINVDGFHVSILLKTTINPKKHYTNIIFSPSEERRRFLIEKEVEYVRKAQNEAYEKKLASIDDLARDQAMAQMGVIALNNVKKINVKYDKRVRIDTNEEVTIYVDKFYDYQQYVFLKFFIENTSNTDLSVSDVTLSAVTEGDEGVPLKTALLCQGLVRAGDEKPCVITTRERNILSARILRMSFASNHGPFTLSW